MKKTAQPDHEDQHIKVYSTKFRLAGSLTIAFLILILLVLPISQLRSALLILLTATASILVGFIVSERKIKHRIQDLLVEQKKLEENHHKNEAVLKSIEEGIIVLDKDAKILNVNKRAEQALESASDTLTGKNLDQFLLVEPDRGYFVKASKFVPTLVSSKSDKLDLIIHIYQKDEKKIRVQASFIPILQNRESPVFILMIADIYKEKEIDKMRAEFLSIAAHQMRTPLGNISWSLELLLDGDFGILPPKIKETIQQIAKSNQWMITLINDLLNSSRVEAGRIQNRPEPIDQLEIASEVIAELQNEIKEKSLSIELATNQKKFPKIMLDQKRYREVIQNLLSNAVNYSKSGSKINLSIFQSNILVKITVKDSGIGIPADDKAMIFSKFFRAKNAIRASSEGTGLGLYVVKSYVEGWGGTIWFDSTLEKGTTFYLEFPIPKNHTEPSAKPPKKQKGETAINGSQHQVI